MAGNRLDTETILRELSISDAPVRRRGIEEAVEFLSKECRLPWRTIYSYLEALDLSKPVRRRPLKPDTVLIGYRNRKAPYGQFYTVAGTSPRDVGVELRGRVYILYRVHTQVEALESRASAFTHIRRGSGGALQYIVPFDDAKRRLEILRMGQREQT